MILQNSVKLLVSTFNVPNTHVLRLFHPQIARSFGVLLTITPKEVDRKAHESDKASLSRFDVTTTFPQNRYRMVCFFYHSNGSEI